MKILAFDTAYSTCSVGLLVDEQVVVSEEPAVMRQGSLILPAIARMLHSFSIQVEDLDLVVFGKGPGSFTGIRIASSVAQGIAFGAQKPAIPVSSMAALAQTAYMCHGWENVTVCIDARMNQLYCGEYKLNNDGIMVAITAEHLCSSDALPIEDKTAWYGVGDGWSVYAGARTGFHIDSNRIDCNMRLSAHSLLTLGQAGWRDGGLSGHISDAIPHYLR